MPKNLRTPKIFIDALKKRFENDDYKFPMWMKEKGEKEIISYRIKQFIKEELKKYEKDISFQLGYKETFPIPRTVDRAFISDNSISEKLLDVCGCYIYEEKWKDKRAEIIEASKKTKPLKKETQQENIVEEISDSPEDWLSEQKMLIQIREVKKTELGDFDITVHFGDDTAFEVQLINPTRPKEEEDLEWYFETYISEPYTANTKIDRCKKSLKDYGKRLFESVFSENKDVFEKYLESTNNHRLSDLTIEIVGESYEFQSIHWESMRDPLHTVPLTIKGIVFLRRNKELPIFKAKVLPSPVLNLLIVTARPNEEKDVNHRTIQRPLIDLIQESAFRIKPHILRPGTFKEFMQHLDHVAEGYYHIIHFDLHGKVSTWEELTTARETNKLSFQQYSFGQNSSTTPNKRYGVDVLEPFEGKRAFIFFESDEPGVAVPIAASEIAGALETKHIPACILNACQSAKQDGDTNEGSIGRALIERSMHLVLAMSYSISVTGAKQLMKQLYYKLLSDNYSLEKAVSSGRKSLFDEKKRTASLGYEIDLEDWILPVVFKNKDFKFQLRGFTSEEKTYYNTKEDKHAEYTPPQHGFLGRDLDILKIEKSLLEKNHLLIIGMVGVGKSALLKYLSWWWQVTDFVEDVFYFDFNASDFTIEDIVRTIALVIMTETDYDQKITNEEHFINEKGEVITLLKEKPYCIIIDNIFQLEDVEIIKFLKRIIGKSYVVYGSVNPENAIKEKIQFSTYRLNGLDEEANYALAKKILKESCNKEIKDVLDEEQFDFQHLLKLLMGFPSMLEIILPKLKDLSVKELLDSFQSGTLRLDN